MKENSMLYWFPLVKDLPIPQPKTVMVPLKGALNYEVLNSAGYKDGAIVYLEENLSDPLFKTFLAEIKVKAKEIGYPLFMRSDETSNKFDWGRSCYVKAEADLFPNMCNIIEFIAMAFGLSFSGVALREFLDLDSRFTSHRGMPVAAEWRFFVKDGEVECYHPYWPPNAIESPSIKDWREVLDELQTEDALENILLTGYAEIVGRKLGGYWSIDLCRHRDQRWFLTDMALGKDSYHWGTCPYAPPEMLAHYGDPLIVKKDTTADFLEQMMEDVKKREGEN